MAGMSSDLRWQDRSKGRRSNVQVQTLIRAKTNPAEAQAGKVPLPPEDACQSGTLIRIKRSACGSRSDRPMCGARRESCWAHPCYSGDSNAAPDTRRIGEVIRPREAAAAARQHNRGVCPRQPKRNSREHIKRFPGSLSRSRHRQIVEGLERIYVRLIKLTPFSRPSRFQELSKKEHRII